MVNFSFDELEQVGAETADFLKQAASSTANFACSLYRDYPWAMTGGQPYGFAKGVWDSLCANRPPGLPTPPAIPFTGGQCFTQYKINMEASYSQGDPPQTRVDRYLQRYDGPIVGVRTDKVLITGGDKYMYSYEFFLQVGNPISEVRQFQTQWGAYHLSFGVPEPYVRINSVVRADGQSDNCGNLSSEYPQIKVPVSRTTGDLIIPVRGTNITVPVIFTPGVGFDANFKLADNINLRFDFDGVSAEVSDSIKELQDSVKELLDRVPKPLKPVTDESYNDDETSEENSKDKDGVEGLKYVLVELISVPKNAKRQSGGDAQDIIYSGWFQFISDGYYFNREPIHFARSLFTAPAGCTGYAYTLYQGFRAKITEIKEEPITEEIT